jgi:uncharacterized protein (TIGR02118 family)
MYCVSIAYPQTAGACFDFSYYLEQHIPMVTGLLGDNCLKSQARKGITAPDGSPAAFVCLATIWISSVDEFQATLAQHGASIIGDIANFTDIQPLLQIDEVLA